MASYRKGESLGLQGIVSLIVLCLAILVLISFYLPAEVSGAMGVFFRYVAYGLCGPLYHCIPLLLLLTAWLGFRHKRHGLPKQLIVHCLIMYMLVAALIQFFTLDQNAFIKQVEQMTQFYQHTQANLWFAQSEVRATTSINLLWQASIEPGNFPLLQDVRPVGVLAGAFSLAFHELFGSLVGKIVLLILLAGEIRIIFGFSLLEWLITLKDVLLASNENIKQAVHETMQELAEQKANDLEAGESYAKLSAPDLTDDVTLAADALPEPIEANSGKVLEAINELNNEPNTNEAADIVDKVNSAPIVTAYEAELEPYTANKSVELAQKMDFNQTVNTETDDTTHKVEAEKLETKVENASNRNLQVEPKLIDSNAWRKQANSKIWAKVEAANLFNPSFKASSELAKEAPKIAQPISPLDNRPATQFGEMSLSPETSVSNEPQTEVVLPQKTVSNLKAHSEPLANQAEQAALNREYDILNKSSLQPQFAVVEEKINVDPFDLDPTADEIGTQLPTDKQLMTDFNIWTQAKNRQAYMNNGEMTDLEPNNVKDLSINSAANNNSAVTESRPTNMQPEMHSQAERTDLQLGTEADSLVETKEVPSEDISVHDDNKQAISKGSRTNKNVELLADLDLANNEPEHSTRSANVKYTQREAKDSLLKESALQQLVEKPAMNKPDYVFPDISLLTEVKNNSNSNNTEQIRAQADKLESTLKSFGVDAEVINITTGPTITRFELSPGIGVKVSKIVNLNDDIALSLAATGVRIEAPIPGKSAIGIEIPNKEKRVVDLRSLLVSSKWLENQQPLKVALGRDIPGQALIADLADMTHTLIAGATGSGKSICINAILISLLYHCQPDELKLILVDPKVVELSVYNGIPHLLAPVVTDPKKAAKALNWACGEMERRYTLLAKAQVRDIKSYNEYVNSHAGFRQSHVDSNGQLVYEIMQHMPYLVVVIDELADLMMTAPQEVEDAINRIAAKGRACGIHLILATQRPSVDVITGVIKANVPSRIAFAVSSQVDSRTILDGSGAEKLLGKGDMLYNPRGAIKSTRGQGAFISDQDVEAVVKFIKENNVAYIDEATVVDIFVDKSDDNKNVKANSDQDELFDAAVETILDAGYASVSILQRRLNIGYPRAGRLIDSLEQAGFIGPANSSKPREIKISRSDWEK